MTERPLRRRINARTEALDRMRRRFVPQRLREAFVDGALAAYDAGKSPLEAKAMAYERGERVGVAPIVLWLGWQAFMMFAWFLIKKLWEQQEPAGQETSGV